MKFLPFFLFFINLLFSQSTQPQIDRFNFEPGEIIVKLKDDVDTNIAYSPNGKAFTNFNIAELLDITDKIESSALMFHKNAIESSLKNKQRIIKLNTDKIANNPNNNFIPQEPMSMKNVFVFRATR